MTLQQFLNQNTVDGIFKEVVVSNRFKVDNGEIFNFKIKDITQWAFYEVKRKAMFENAGLD